MKQLFLFTLAGSLFFISCNNSSNQPRSADSTGTAAAPNTGEPATPPATSSVDSTKTSDPYTTAMNDMMSRMHAVKMTGDFDVDFANMMVAHHQGAIEMAQVEAAQGKDETMKSKAQEILTKQKEEQQKLQDFVGSYKPSGMKHGEGELNKSMTNMMSQMGGMMGKTGGMMGQMQNMPMSGDVDKIFASMMANHHEQGIKMSKMEVQYGMSKNLKQMAKKSIDEQTKDNKEFTDWLNTHK